MRVSPSGPSGLVAVAVAVNVRRKRPQRGICVPCVDAYVQEGFATGTLSDAEFTEGKPIGYGWVAFIPGHEPRAASGVVPNYVKARWTSRKLNFS